MKIGMKLVLVILIFLTIIIWGCGSSPSVPANSGSSSSVPDELDLAIRDASDYLNDNIPKGSMIVILNVQSDSASLSDYVIDELIANAVNDKIFKVVDRRQLDLIRAEQNFQLSGEVDDKLAVSIGKVFGAQTIVSGKVVQVGERYRMTIRALEVQTAQVQGQYNRNIVAGKTITALMKNGGSGRGTQNITAGTTGSNSSGNVAKIVPTVTSVIVSPDSVSVDKGKTQQFSATVSGINNPEQTVTWTIIDNASSKTSINEDGILTVGADESITPLTVTATSTVDINKKGRATIAVPGGNSALNVNSVAAWNATINRIRNGGNDQNYVINVTGNVSVPPPPNNENIFGTVTGITVTIQGNSTLSLSVTGCLLRIGAGQTVILKNVTLRGCSGNDGAVVRISNGGIFRMEGNAKVTGNTTNSRSAGGVFVNGGTFIIQENASVTGNNANSWNTSDGGCNGGGVYVGSGTFLMQGGSVSGNTAAGRGGGVFVDFDGTFIMESGTISGNTTADDPGYGGGVAVSGSFTMKGGTITGNTAKQNGWGVAVGVKGFRSGGTFTMQGGTITGGNNAGSNGGGVYIMSGNFNKSDGIISGNDVSFGDRNTARQGYAVYLNSGNRWRNATAGSDDKTDSYGFWLND